MHFSRRSTLLEIMEIKGVKVFAHWSVLLIGTVVLLGGVQEPLLAFAVLAAYYGLILIHECGHMIAARWRGCAVWSIELYPVWGTTLFSEPNSRFDACVIAWAGVVAQGIVAVPLVAWVEVLGYTHFEPVNAVLAILGFFSLGIAVLNLLPVPPLDGAIAWSLLPALFKPSTRMARREPNWRSWR